MLRRSNRSCRRSTASCAVWAGFSRYGNSARAFDKIRAYAVMRIALFVAQAASAPPLMGLCPSLRIPGQLGTDLARWHRRRTPALAGPDRIPSVKGVGEPDEGEPHVRFDGGELEEERATIVESGRPREARPRASASPTARHLASSLPNQPRLAADFADQRKQGRIGHRPGRSGVSARVARLAAGAGAQLRSPQQDANAVRTQLRCAGDIHRLVLLRIAEDRRTEPYGQLRGVVDSPAIHNELTRIFGRADDRYNSRSLPLRGQAI